MKHADFPHYPLDTWKFVRENAINCVVSTPEQHLALLILGFTGPVPHGDYTNGSYTLWSANGYWTVADSIMRMTKDTPRFLDPVEAAQWALQQAKT